MVLPASVEDFSASESLNRWPSDKLSARSFNHALQIDHSSLVV